jgi:hypothetical protein
MTRNKHSKDKKLHNSHEKLHNSHEPDLTWQEGVDLLPEDEGEGSSEIYYFTDEDGNIHSREFLAEELIPDESKVEGPPKRKPSGKLEKLKRGAIEIINLEAPNDPPSKSPCPHRNPGNLPSTFEYPVKLSRISPQETRQAASLSIRIMLPARKLKSATQSRRQNAQR